MKHVFSSAFFGLFCGVMLALVLMSVNGCAGSSSKPMRRGGIEAERRHGALIPMRTVAHAVRNRPIFVPVQPPVDGVLPATLVTTPSGTVIDASIVRIRAEAIGREGAPTDALGRVEHWISPAVRWTSIDAEAPKSGMAEAWLVIVRPEADALIESMIVGSTPVLVQWHDGASALGGSSTPTVDSTVFGSRWLAGAIDPVARSPFSRWRWRLLKHGQLGAVRAPFDDPTLEAVAQQEEAAWSEALGRLASISLPLEIEVRRRLVQVADFGDGVVVPAWVVGDDRATVLRDGLLRRTRSDERIATLAESWLQSQADLCAWIGDDASAIDIATGEVVSRISVLNLSDRSTTAFVRSSSGRRQSGLETFEPGRVGDLATRSDSSGVDQTAPTLALRLAADGTAVTVLGGDSALTRRVRSIPFPVSPPGLRLSPFGMDWTLATWMASSTVADDREAVVHPAFVGAMLYRDDQVSGSGVKSLWTLFVECGAEEGVPIDGDVVEVFVGPSAATQQVLRATPDGRVTLEGMSGESTIEAKVVRSDERWSIWIPMEVLSGVEDGRAHLGVLRVDSHGSRSAWPRPMLPWQTVPSRAVVDLARWDRSIPTRARPREARNTPNGSERD